jgi:hypothetical protein
MLYDRLVGAFGVLVALICMATITAILSDSFSAYIEPLKYACFLACLVPMFYMQGYVARRDDLPHDGEGVDIWPILRVLPVWAAATNLLFMLLLFLCFGLFLWSTILEPPNVGVCVDAAAHSVRWSQGSCVLVIPKSSLVELLFLIMPLCLSFLCGSYLLFRRQP